MPLVPNKEFLRRVLLVDNDEGFLDELSTALQERAYEVLIARNGFEALYVLRGATPDLLITELNLPNMSGFELLSVVRSRFPQIAVIATSNDYTTTTLPAGTITDAFIAKGPNTVLELIETALNLIRESPLRSSRRKTDRDPAWIPRSATGYIILTCPECLRSFSVTQPGAATGEPLEEECLSCGAKVTYSLSSTPVAAPPKGPRGGATSRELIQRSRSAISNSKQALFSSKALLERQKDRDR